MSERGQGPAEQPFESVRRRIEGLGKRARRQPLPGSPPRDRFDKFTERARNVLSLAQEEARRFNHNYIGTEHLLLGLVRDGEGVAAKALANMGVELDRVRGAVEFIIGRGDHVIVGEVGLTPRAKKVIELAVDEARRLRHRYIGTEHLLLGLIREGEGIAAGVLESTGVHLDQARVEVMKLLVSAAPSTARDNVVTFRVDDRDLEAIDALIEAGVRSTRSDAAAWLIHAGIEANRALFERVNDTVEEIRRLRREAQAISEQVTPSDAAQAEHGAAHTGDEGTPPPPDPPPAAEA